MVNRGPGRTAKILLDQMQLNDGVWHDLQFHLQDARSSHEARYIITLSLDFGFYQVSFEAEGQSIHAGRKTI